MIKIGKINIEICNGLAYLKGKVFISNDTAIKYKEATSKLKNAFWETDVDYPPKSWRNEGTELWFAVKDKYSEFLCYENSDAFVIALFWYAMITGSDIYFEAPISSKLYDGLTNYLIPKLKIDREIKLIGPKTNKNLNTENAVGTGMSFGVDSFYTMRTKKLTHILLCEKELFGEYNSKNELLELENKKILLAEDLAKKNKLEFIYVSSNVKEDFYRGGIIYRGMYRNVSCAMALQKLFRTYYSSSSGHEHDLEIGLTVPTQNYENFICDNIKTESFDFVNSDNVRRLDKLKLLCDDKDFMNCANVCFNSFAINCGECFGCLKTMIMLDLLGKLKNFNKVFDLDKYYKNRFKYIDFIASSAKKTELLSLNEAWNDIVDYAKSHDTELSKYIRGLSTKPNFSVIVSAYNIEKYIGECIKSIMEQTYEDFECIVVDDGSSDNTFEVVKKMTKDDKRFFVYKIIHGGPQKAKDYGLKRANGRYVIFPDGDDTFDKNCFRESARLIDGYDLLIFGINYQIYDEGQLISEKATILQNMEFNNGSELAKWYIENKKILLYSLANKFYNNEVIKENKISFNQNFSFGEDRIFNFEYLKYCKKIRTISGAYYNYRKINKFSLTSTYRHHFIDDLVVLHKEKIEFLINSAKDIDDSLIRKYKNYDITKEIYEALKHICDNKEKMSSEEYDEELNYLIKYNFPLYFYIDSKYQNEDLISYINSLLFEEDEKIDKDLVNTAIVLGSNNCEYRVKKAYDTFSYNPKVKYICCGGNISKNKDNNGCGIVEAEFMAKYLSDRGVKNIKVENKSKNTIENLKYAKAFLEKSDNSVVVTAAFHKKRVETLLQQENMNFVVLSAYGENTEPNNWYKNSIGIDGVFYELLNCGEN